ncbi:DEAD/DEAH box helicase [Sinomonas halotolerans]|uniref:DEAD/DEAH box helicase n=1 Tax=Sinomonas halotolerans TaxID=1644133 RepID=A0ABU9X1I9_9MICC
MAAHDSLVPLLGRSAEPAELRHVRTLPARAAQHAPWPEWVHPDLVAAYARLGIGMPYTHQAEAASLAHAGSHVVLATGTASGKSLAYQLPALDAVHRSELRVAAEPGRIHDDGAAVLYLSPTKALAADQLAALRSLRLPTLRAETYDGDTDTSARRWIRDHANVILANPDMLHFGILPNHAWWAGFFRRLRYVVVDEAHSYRGVFGSHVANLLRRLRRVCSHYGSSPVFIAASATSGDPESSVGRLIGSPVVAVTQDGSPHGATEVAFWEPALTEAHGENGAPQRRTAIAEVSDLLASLVAARVRTIAFIKSRRGAEAIASITQRHLDEVDPSLPSRVAAYRSGYLPEERRELERRLRSGELLGVASTSALELGIDVAGLDAVLVAGWPGTRASLFQQIGRAGRAGQEALAAFVASDDPLDTYLVNHPEAIFDVSIEATVLDPSNPYVLGPHLCAAAAEKPLTTADLALFGPTTESLLGQLEAQGYLRRRPSGWFWTHSESAAGMVNLRADGGGPVSIIEAETGLLLGSMDSPQTHYQAHEGAIYVHQGASYLVEELNEADRCVVVRRVNPDYYTTARDLTTVDVLSTQRSEQWGPVGVHFGEVKVTTQVVSFQRKALVSNEVLGEEPLELGARELFTKSVWLTIPEPTLAGAGLIAAQFPGALHAAEHAAIGLLPLVASSDRWDVGGVSTALHADTEEPTVFVYDGHPGGAGFAERGFDRMRDWLAATLAAIEACECETGCPSCVQSPKCGNKNNPLDKSGASALLATVLAHSRGAGEDPAGHARLREAAQPVPGRAPDPTVHPSRSGR